MKKLYIETYGCQMNVADSEVVASVMQMAGYETTENLEEANAVFLNTCSVRDNAEQKIYHRLEALAAIRRKRPLIIGVLGCMAERAQQDLLENHHADLVAGPDAYLSLPHSSDSRMFRYIISSSFAYFGCKGSVFWAKNKIKHKKSLRYAGGLLDDSIFAIRSSASRSRERGQAMFMRM